MSIGGGGSKSSSTQFAMPTFEQRAVARPFSRWLTSRFDPATGEMMAAEPYTGLLTAPLGEGERGVIDQLIAQYPEMSGYFKQVADISPETLESRWRSQYYDPAVKLWGEITEPAIREAYGGPGGYYSSERMEAQRKSSQDLATELARGRAEYMTEAEQRGLEAVMQGAQYAGAVGDIAALPREIEQQALTAQLEEWLRTRPEYSPYIEQILTFLSGPGIQYGTSKAVSQQSSIGI